MAKERVGLVTMKGQPLTLLGPELKVGDAAPPFSAVDREWKPISLSDFKGKVVLISAVPSVDTSVCSAQTRRFNEEAAKLPADVALVTISQDLPFALSRFCAAEGIDRIQVLSDHESDSFGLSYGVLVKGMRLLSRSVWVIGRKGRISYVQLVKELTTHPDYDRALQAARNAAAAK